MLSSINLTSLKTIIPVVTVVTIAGCASTDKPTPYRIKNSPLQLEQNSENLNTVNVDGSSRLKETKIESVDSIGRKDYKTRESEDLSFFSSKDDVKVALDNLSVKDFIHQLFGKVLTVNYVIEDTVNAIGRRVTLNINTPVSSRELYQNAKLLLAEQGVDIGFKNNVFYLYNAQNGNNSISSSVGRTVDSVPNSNGQILQIIPLKYGVNISLERTLKQLSKASISADPEQSTVFVKGSREEILQVMDLIDILDRPSHQGKHIGFLQLNFISITDFIETVKGLLESEGVPTGVKVQSQKNLALIPLHQIGAVAIFASDKEFLDRVEFWAKKLDKAPSGDTKQYFIYRPKFARAQDLGESLRPLFSDSVSNESGNSSRDTKSAVANKVEGLNGSGSVGNEDIKIVIDQRANFVIVHTTGREYQAILPLIKNLDVMPKQILLEATIAEVTLRDEFEYGVEFFLEDGKFSFSTRGALGLTDIAGGALNVAGSVNSLQAKFIQRNNLVNILSNPTLLVRDGIAATITVGDEIPIEKTVTTLFFGVTIQ